MSADKAPGTLETETPVAETAAPAPDTRSPEEKAATSHLDHFHPEEPEAPADDEKVVTVDVKLPKTIRGTIEAMAELRKENPTSPLGKQERDAKLAKLKEHHFNLCQGPQPPELNTAKTSALADLQSEHAHNFRLNLLAKEHPEVRDVIQELKDANELSAARDSVITGLKKELAEAQELIAKLSKK